MDLGKGKVRHSFLVIPECPAPLLGRDLLTKLRARITFNPEGPQMEFLNPLVKTPIVMALTMSVEDEHQLFTPPKTDQTGKLSQKWITDYPDAWAETAGLGLAVKQPPIMVELKTSASPINIKQYPLSKEAKDGIRPHIQKYLDLGVLRPCQLAWNTPLLPVKKPGTGDYRPVQDLREIDNRVQDIHPTVPNPYNLLSTLNPERKWYTVLDLKDAFFCLPLHKDSQLLFAFEWVDPETGTSGQLTWTRLPQGFKNSPTLFDEALHRDLNNFRTMHPEVTLLQYVDDLLLAADTRENSTLLPEQSSEPVTHDCQHILAEETSVRRDLKDQPLPHPEVIWFTDGSSFLQDGKRWAGATIVSRTKVIWSSSLPEGTSTQKAELIALTKALELAAGKKATIYTDSRYAFATAHIHGAIYQQRGLLTSAGKEIKNKDEILRLLSAVQSPKELAIVHCPGHQKGNDPVAVGNRRADEEAKLAALNGITMLTLSTREKYKSGEHPNNLTKDSDTELLDYTEPSLQFQKALHYVKNVHQLTHLGSKKLQAFLKDQEQSFPLTGSQRRKIAEQVTKACRACQLVNAYPSKLPVGRRLRGTRPGQFWEVDFTEIKPARYGLKYLLIFVDTFS
ncbi:uncharacterized protein LOC144371000 [Ictidomys tridecemlineatus]